MSNLSVKSIYDKKTLAHLNTVIVIDNELVLNAIQECISATIVAASKNISDNDRQLLYVETLAEILDDLKEKRIREYY